MNISAQWSKLQKNKGLYHLVLRTIIFGAIIFGTYFAIFVWIRHLPFFEAVRIGDQYYISWLTGLRKTDFLNAGVFSAIAFVVWNRLTLIKAKHFEQKWLQTVSFAILALAGIIGHYVFKYLLAQSQPEPVWLMTLIKYSLLILFIGFTALAIYTKEFLSWILRTYWKSLLIFITIGAVYFFLIQFFQLIWYELSYFVGFTISKLLTIGHGGVVFTPGSQFTGPRLGAEGFLVGISNECSGIDSLLLFLSLYTLLLVLDWKRMHVKRMLILIIPGLIGTVAYNILRIYLLMLVGIHIDPRFAVDVFHTNIGWILFLVFFIIFWHFGSKWVYKPKKKGKKK